MNIAYEISPILSASGFFGDKSGVYRITFDLISNMSEHLLAIDPDSKIFLYTLNPYLLLEPNSDLDYLLAKKNVFTISYPKLPVNLRLDDIDSIGLAFRPIRKLRNLINNFFIDRFRFQNYFSELEKELAKKQVSIVHLSETGFIPFKNIPCVITINDLIPFLYPQWQRQETVKIHLRKLNTALKMCQGIICISQNTKKDLVTLFSKYIKNQNIEVIYPSLSNFHPEELPASFREVQKIVKKNNAQLLVEGKYFLFFSTYEPRKNIASIIIAFLKIQKNFKDYKLVLVGGDGWGNVREKIIKGIQEHFPLAEESPIIALNFLSDKYLQTLLKNCAGVVYPSLYEGFGMPIIEALSYGVPVITSDLSSMPEAGGDAAIYINPRDTQELADAMAKVASDSIDKKINRSLAIKQLNKFSWEKNVCQHHEFYAKVLKK